MNTTPDTPLTRDAIAAALTAAGFPVSPATKYAPDALLTRAATAAALTDTGFPVSPATLATQATRGGGPPYLNCLGAYHYIAGGIRSHGPKISYPRLGALHRRCLGAAQTNLRARISSLPRRRL